LNPKPIG